MKSYLGYSLTITQERRVVGWLMNWEGFGRKRSWPNRVITQVFAWKCWGKPRKTYQYSRCPGQNSNQAPPDCVLERYRYSNLLCTIQLYACFQEYYLVLRRTTPHLSGGPDGNEKDPRSVSLRAIIWPRDLLNAKQGYKSIIHILLTNLYGLLRHYVNHRYVHLYVFIPSSLNPYD
jgi:hypothetical protein